MFGVFVFGFSPCVFFPLFSPNSRAWPRGLRVSVMAICRIHVEDDLPEEDEEGKIEKPAAQTAWKMCASFIDLSRPCVTRVQ